MLVAEHQLGRYTPDETAGFQSFKELLNHIPETAAYLFSAKPDIIRATCQREEVPDDHCFFSPVEY